MGDYNLGTARGTIEIDYKGDGVTQASKGLGGLKKDATSADDALNKTGTTATVAGGLIVGGLALAVKSAASFEERLSAIKAVSGNTAAEMEKVRSKALQIGKDTSFSATEAATAMEELSKAGISTTDILGGAADATVALAAAGEVDLPFAAGIASNAMNQFNLKAADLPNVANKIAGAANASAIDVKEFGYSLSQVGAVAHLAGLSFDDTAVAIAEMGNAGIKGSDAGTSLKTMLMRLQPTTKSALNAMEDLGLVTYENEKAMAVLRERGIKPTGTSYMAVREAIMRYVEAQYGYKKGSTQAKDATDKFITANGILQNQFYDQQGNLKSLKDIQDLLGKSLQGLTNEQKQMYLTTIFGSDAVRGAAVLANNGAAGFDKLATAMGKVTAADVAKTRLDNVNGSLEQLKGSLETAGIQLGTIFLPAIRSIVDGLTGFLNIFLALPDGVQKFIGISALFIGTLLLIVGGIIKAKLAFDALKVTMIALNGTFLANPLFWVIAGIVALVAALVIAYKNSETFRNIVNGAWSAIKDGIGAVVNWITGTVWPAIQGAWDKIAGGAQALWQWIQSAWDNIQSGTSTAWGAIVSVVLNFWNSILDGARIVWDFIKGVIEAAVGFVVTVITTQLDIVKGIWNAVWGTFGPLVKAVWDFIVALTELAFALLNYAVNTGINAIKAIIETAWNFIKTITSATWDFIRGVVTAFFGWVQPYIQAAVTFIGNVVKAAWDFVKNVFLAFWNWATPYVTGAANAVKNGISVAWDFIVDKTSAAFNKVKGWITDAWNFIRSSTTDAWGYVSRVVSDKAGEVMRWVSNLVSNVKNFFADAGKWLYNAGRDIIQGLINGLTSMINSLTDKLHEVTKLIPNSKGPASKDKILLEQNGELIMSGLIHGINNMVMPLRDTLSGIGTSIPDTITASVAAGRAEESGAFAAATAGSTYVTNIYNPLPEPAGESTNKRLQTLASMGV